jgi:TonB-dependent SusC/RagA subfamily outer membrane receptor
MKNSTFCTFLGFFFISITINAQITDQPPAKNEHRINVQLPFEKVYLHLDRTFYTSHDDIWFKAYLIDAVTDKLSNTSNNLYVELISPGSEIIKRLCIRLDKGLGIGDFHLGDSIPSGKYQVRAYTNWMRNFGEVFFFKKEIDVENLIGLKTDVKPQVSREGIDVRFFPEGGQLIQDVYEIVGFKAITSDGYGCNVKGKVISSDGDTVDSFESNHLGMGSFSFISKKGKTYVAMGTSSNGIKFRTDLPVASKKGFALKVTEFDKDNLWVTIKTNQEMLSQCKNQELILAGTSHGNLFVTAKIKVKALLNSVAVPKSAFPEGIARITLEDTLGKPYCERLFYISGNKSYSLTIEADKKVIVPRQKVTLKISARDTSGNPVSAFLSLSAVNEDGLQKEVGKSNILSYFNLESEIRGVIEQPSYYFDPAAPDRLKALDNLLLTQGWRDFVWKYLSDTTIKINYPIEKGLSVSGRLRRLMVDKPIANANIYMGMFGDAKPSIYFTKTDSTGKYYFDGLNFTGQRTVVISATNKNNRSQGWISLDSLFSLPPNVLYSPIYKNELQNSEASEFKQEVIRKYNILKKYHLTDTIPLNEVVIQANRPAQAAEDDHFRLYGTPDYSLTVTDQYSSYRDVFQLIQGRVAGLSIIGMYPSISFSMRGSQGTPLFLLDGMPVDIDVIASVPVPDIDKVEVLKDGASLAIFGSRGGNGVISVFTKTGHPGSMKPVFHSINQNVNGFYQARTFYAPKYDIKKPEQEKPDLRTTVYWEPNIITDNQGNAFVSFFNSDDKDVVSIQVEGISESGVPLVGKTNYEVK